MGIDARMLVRTRYPYSQDELKAWRFDLHAAFGSAVWASRKRNRRALEEVCTFWQDGPSIEPEPGERFLDVGLSGRYYGAGYERGSIVDFIAIAEWLERRIPGAAIWYGGDSSGVLAKPFDVAARETVFSHFAEHGHLPYTGDPRKGRTDKLAVFAGEPCPVAPTCPFCEVPMLRTMWGGGPSRAAGYTCLGCDYKARTEDGEIFEPSDA